MATPGTMYTPEMDNDLLVEVVLYNPFKKDHSWPGLKRHLVGHPVFEARQPKSMRDRTLLLMARRKAHVAPQERASGIEVALPTPLESALDEAIVLRAEAEREERPKPVELEADRNIKRAAECLGGGALNEPGPRAESLTPSAKRKKSGDLTEMLRAKLEFEQQTREQEREERLRQEEDKQLQEDEMFRRQDAERKVREDEKQQRKEERMALLAEAAKDRELKREELSIRKREVELQERREAGERNERTLLLQLLAKLVAKE